MKFSHLMSLAIVVLMSSCSNSDFSANGTWCWRSKAQFGSNDFHVSDATMLIRANGKDMPSGTDFTAKRAGDLVHFNYKIGEYEVEDIFTFKSDDELILKESFVDGKPNHPVNQAAGVSLVRCP